MKSGGKHFSVRGNEWSDYQIQNRETPQPFSPPIFYLIKICHIRVTKNQFQEKKYNASHLKYIESGFRPLRWEQQVDLTVSVSRRIFALNIEKSLSNFCKCLYAFVRKKRVHASVPLFFSPRASFPQDTADECSLIKSALFKHRAGSPELNLLRGQPKQHFISAAALMSLGHSKRG